MQQADSRNHNGCSCSDWQKNIPYLESLSLLGMTHGRNYEGTPFRFCPWCGTPLAGATHTRDEALWQKYQQRIEETFFGKDDWNMPQIPNMLVAARPVTDYQQATGDVLGTLELMLTFVEAGTRFTNQYGDIDEAFYEGLELMLDDFRDLLLANPGFYHEREIAQRLADLQQNVRWLGWGYGDYVLEQVDLIQQEIGDV